MAYSDYPLSEIVEKITDLAVSAGALALKIYGTDFETETKSDDSPVTKADELGEQIILEGLQKFFPKIPVLAEESAAAGKIPALGDEFFLVDPLDGTKEFVNKTGEFTVNIALIRSGAPVAGVVLAPALRKVYTGAQGLGAFVRALDDEGNLKNPVPISSRAVPSEGLTAVASRSHRSAETDDYLRDLNVADFAAAGSSLKFCLIAEGKADIYPRFGRTMEWDTGAGQAVLEAAGGAVVEHPEGTVLRYGKKDRDYDNPYFIATGQSHV